MAQPKKELQKKPTPLEHYEPGATREQVLAGLRKAAQGPKKSAERPDRASSRT